MQPAKALPDADIDPLDRAANDAIAACGGDLRATVKALVADNITLSKELDFATLAHSYGYSRGWFARQRAARQQSE